MTDLESRKAEPGRRPRSERPNTRPRRDVAGILLYILGYGGMVAVALFLLLALPRDVAEQDSPHVSLQSSMRELMSGQLPDTPSDTAAPDDELDGHRDSAPAAREPDPTPEPAPPLAEDDDEAPPPPPGGIIVGGAREALVPPVPVVPREEPAAVPDAPEPPASGATSADGCRLYPVLAGDATPTIARRLGVTREQLREWNPSLGAAGPEPGSKLRVCSDGKVIVGWREKEIQVRRGDTILKLARQHGLSIENLTMGNRIDPDRIQIGQTITVYEAVWDSP